MTDLAVDLYAQTASAPSEISYDLYGQDDPHADCGTDLYGQQFCMATHKPGPCKRMYAQPVARPHVAVPGAPAAKTQVEVGQQQATVAGYQQAYQNALHLAQQLGANTGHARVQSATQDYAHALHGYNQATAQADAARAVAQRRHDSAQAQNKAIDAHNAARQAAYQARVRMATAHQALHAAAHAHSAKAPKNYTPAGFALTEADLYGLAGDPGGFYLQPALAHWGCHVGEFCRNPLHPGPCKGWKHMLHSVAPGAYHAYEQARVKKLNDQRLAKIAALKAEGKPVPKRLLKEITYEQVPKAPTSGTPFVAPTPKEAAAALPATAKEIAGKLAEKHAAIAKAKVAKQWDALANMAEAAGIPVGPGAHKMGLAKLQDVAANLKPGEKISDHPVVQNSIDKIMAALDSEHGPLKLDQKVALANDIEDHVNEGITELPLTLESVLNASKAKKAAEAEAAAKKAAEEAHAKLKGKQGDALHRIAAALGVVPDTEANKAAFHQAIENAHNKLEPGQKPSQAPGMGSVIGHLTSKANGHLTTLHDQLGTTGPGQSEIYKQLAEHIDEGKLGLPQPIKDIASLKEKLAAKQAKEAADATAAKLAKEKAAAEALKTKVTGPVAHPDMMAALDTIKPGSGWTLGEKLHALKQPGVTKAEYEKLPPHAKTQIIQTLADLHDKQPATVQGIAHTLGIPQVDVMMTPPKITEVAPQSGLSKAAKAKAEKMIANQEVAGPAPHVAHAQSLAIGEVSGTAKVKVSAYEKLTPDEYHSLPLAVQDQINIDLNTAHAKFLDPKKKQQVKAVLDKLGMPKATPEGAGAPHGVEAPVPHETKMAQAHLAAEKLAGKKDETLAQVKDVIHGSYKTHNSPEDVQYAADAISKQWAQHHLSGLPLSDEESQAITAKAEAEIADMITKGETVPPSGGVLHVADHVTKASSTSPHGIAELLKYATGQEDQPHPTGEGAGGGLAAEALKILAEPNTGMVAKAAKLTKEHFNALPSATQGKVLAQLKDVEADAGPQTSALATEMINKLTGKAPAVAPTAAKPVAKKPSGTGLGKGKLIKNFTPGAKAKILQAYKDQGAAAYIDTDVKQNFQAVLNAAHALHGEEGIGSLSLNQAIDIIDEQMAAKVGKPNAKMLRKKIEDWLATPEGAKAAKAMKPNAGQVEELKPPKPMKPGEIVPEPGGPGGYDATLKDGHFVARTHQQMVSLQKKYQADTGQQWTPAQLSAIKYYTGSGYHDINNLLRHGKGSSTAKTHAKNLQAAMTPLQEPSLLVRGTGWSQFPAGFQGAEQVKKLIGKTIGDPGFVSTATAGTGHGFSSSVKLSIEAPKGTMGAYVAHVSSVGESEYEYLLAAGTKFKILSVENKHGQTWVKMRVVSE